jgi:hypothetical protein
MTSDRPFGGSAAGDSPGGVARFPRQPLPTEQSVLWRPAVQELARPDDELSAIFIAQRALAAVDDHLVSAPHEALLGFLVGRVFETPETALPYVIVHGAVRVPQMIVNGATERVVTQSLAAAQRMLPPEDGVVVGWYRSDPTGVLKISADDHAAHLRHFPRPWQVALLLTIRPGGTRGGCFRPAGEPGSPAPYLPFYELLDADSFRDGWKQPRVSWSNYWSPDPAVWRVRSEPARAPRITPSERPSGAGRFVPIMEPEDDDPAWRLPRGRGRGGRAWAAWRWWLLAAAAMTGAVALGVRLGLGPSQPTALPLPEPTATPALTAPVTPAPSAEATAAAAVRQAIAGYRQQASLYAGRQAACADLARGLGAVDEAWLRYTLASPSAAAGDSLAANVDQVEADFERSGCPRP